MRKQNSLFFLSSQPIYNQLQDIDTTKWETERETRTQHSFVFLDLIFIYHRPSIIWEKFESMLATIDEPDNSWSVYLNNHLLVMKIHLLQHFPMMLMMKIEEVLVEVVVVMVKKNHSFLFVSKKKRRKLWIVSNRNV